MRFLTGSPFQFGRSNFTGLGQPLRRAGLGDMQSDIAWFEANRIQISQQYAGQWVIVRGQAVAGAYPDFHSAYGAGTAMFGSDPFVVKEAKAEETPIRLVGRMP
jgi:hypothetical protein